AGIEVVSGQESGPFVHHKAAHALVSHRALATVAVGARQETIMKLDADSTRAKRTNGQAAGPWNRGKLIGQMSRPQATRKPNNRRQSARWMGVRAVVPPPSVRYWCSRASR